ncbi:MAG: mandelate racemase/muconate lactonizing enzyme family protein [Bacteroidota bacterium]
MSRIVRVETGRLDYPLVGAFKFFRTGARPSVVVRLTDDAGRQGWGQSVPVETWTYETVETVETTLAGYLAPAILGADPADPAGIHERMERAIRPSFSVGQPLAKAAIDLACYDLWGKQTGRSAAALLGGARVREVKLSWTVQSPTLAGAEALLVQGRELGYTSYNVKLGYPQIPAYDVELIRMVRRFAPDGFHWADANTSYDLETALAMTPKLAEAGFAALESPLPPARIRDYQALRRQGAVPILMDEGIVSPVETAEFIALGMMDGIAMKVARCGGLWHASRIAHQLEASGLALFASGLSDPEWSLAASIHLFAAAGLERPAALNGPQYIAGRGTADPAFRAVRDVVRVPEGPGLGVAVDERAASALRTAAES